MFERFNDRARRVVVLAQEESRMLGHDRIGTAHLLLGVLRDRDRATAPVLDEMGVTLPAVRGKLLEQSPASGHGGPSGHIPFTPGAKKVLETAVEVTQRLGGQYIGTPHLLRALLEVRDGRAYGLLTDLGVNTDELATRADRLARNDQDPGHPMPHHHGWLIDAGRRVRRGGHEHFPSPM